MNRRSFLQLFAASTTAYFLAPRGGWKSDVIAPAPDYLIGDGHFYHDGVRYERCTGHLQPTKEEFEKGEPLFVGGMPIYHPVSINGQLHDVYPDTRPGRYWGVPQGGKANSRPIPEWAVKMFLHEVTAL